MMGLRHSRMILYLSAILGARKIQGMGPLAPGSQCKPNIAGVIDEKPCSMMCNAEQDGRMLPPIQRSDMRNVTSGSLAVEGTKGNAHRTKSLSPPQYYISKLISFPRRNPIDVQKRISLSSSSLTMTFVLTCFRWHSAQNANANLRPISLR